MNNIPALSPQWTDDASPRHVWLAGEILCLQRGRVLPDDGVAAGDQLQLQVLQNEGRGHLRLPQHCCRLLLHPYSTRSDLTGEFLKDKFDFFLEIINPVFFADPLGALVGKSLTTSGINNPRWVGEKTVGGSLAVFLASYLTLTFGSQSFKLFLSLVITLMEGLTLEFDNLFITATVITGYLYNVHGWHGWGLGMILYTKYY